MPFTRKQSSLDSSGTPQIREMRSYRDSEWRACDRGSPTRYVQRDPNPQYLGFWCSLTQQAHVGQDGRAAHSTAFLCFFM